MPAPATAALPDTRHLLIPAAAPLPTETPEPLRQLLAALQPDERIVLDEDSPAMPCELAVARQLGLPSQPGHTPWAALESRTLGLPCAWLRACHWQMGMDHVRMAHPDALSLDLQTSNALLHAMQPYFTEDGIALHPSATPGQWLAVGEPLRGLRCVSLARVAGRDVKPWINGPLAERSAAALLWQRLHSEMQMLFYSLPLNDARQQQGQLPVNALWLLGAGALDALPPTPSPTQPHFKIENRLAETSSPSDPARAIAWQAIAEDSCTWLLQQLQAGQPVRLTLCGEHAAQSFTNTPQASGHRLPTYLPHWLRKAMGRIGPAKAHPHAELLNTL